VWQRAFGDSEAMLRLPSALAGVLWIPAIFLVGWRLFGHQEGLVAAGLVAVGWAPIYFSQEARAYAFLILMIMLAAYCWAGVVREQRTWAAVGYTLCAAVTLYLHPMGLIFVALAGAAMGMACIGSRRGAVTFCLVHLAILVLYMPWLPEFVRDTRTVEVHLDRPGLGHLGRLFVYMFNRSLPLTLVAVGFYALLAYRSVRQGISRAELMLVLWVVVPVAAVVVLSHLSTPILTNRNMLICLPPMVLLMARAIATLPLNPLRRGLIAAVVVGVFLGQLLFQVRYYRVPRKTQFREAVRFVVDRERDTPGARVVACVWIKDHVDYYFEKLGSPTRVAVMGSYRKQLPAVRAFLAEHRPRYIWYVQAHRPISQDILNHFKDRYHLVEQRSFIKAATFLFEDRTSQPRSAPASSLPAATVPARTTPR
jgi:uncharacterized membrane protein